MIREGNVRVRLVNAAKAEFLRCGYQKASLRTIAQAAGVSTGSVYFFFGSKEELFHAVVDEAAARLRVLLTKGIQTEYEGTVAGEENDRALIECLHAYPDEATILLEKAGDSPIAGFRQEVIALLEKGFLRFFYRAGGSEADAPLVSLVVEQRVQALLTLISRGYDAETTMKYAVLLGAYGEAGFSGMMKHYQHMKESPAG